MGGKSKPRPSATLAACLALACGAQIGDPVGATPGSPTGSGPAGTAPGVGGTNPVGGNGPPGGIIPGVGPGAGGLPASCNGKIPAAGPSPLRRLTHREFNNTVRDLLGDSTSPASTFAPEEQVLGFDNNAEARGVSPVLAEQYMNGAEQIAARAALNLPKLMGCSPADAPGQDACADQFVRNFGKRAFRRPLDAVEIARFTRLYATGRDRYGFPMAVQLVLQAFLQSSPFLYRIELGKTMAAANVATLSPWEIASRLSYLLWGSMPDDALLAAAGSGQLATKEQVAAQARRMLQDVRVRSVLADFNEQWLDLEKIDTVEKNPMVVSGYTDDLRPLMRIEVETFVDAVLSSDKPTLTTLFQAPFSYMNAKLAAFYGVKGPTGTAFSRVDQDPTQRSGILTLGGLLSIHAHPDQSSPVHRGLFVRRDLLCTTPPPPPPNVVIEVPNVDSTLTTRERFAQHSTDPFCRTCHQLMDPIGLGFEAYDPAGRYRTAENGKPIDASGEIIDSDIPGTFVGPIDLASRLVRSQQAANCMVTQWFRYGYGRDELKDADACNSASLRTAFAASGENIRELLLALTQTDGFLYRSVPEGEAP
jgi:Protein of unknown function (DUF1592)/Protein of unknown function (DUF1588)/Protein of unknown function (DUF1587)/Protein of unknown function (DUF1595)/Protein of unknown function (DUF1585)